MVGPEWARLDKLLCRNPNCTWKGPLVAVTESSGESGRQGSLAGPWLAGRQQQIRPKNSMSKTRAVVD